MDQVTARINFIELALGTFENGYIRLTEEELKGQLKLEIEQINATTVQRPSSTPPGDTSVVYGVILLRNGDIAAIGTAFAISDSLAISAWRNFTDYEYQPSTDEVILCKEIRKSVLLRSSPVAVVLDYNVEDDWVTLQLASSALFPSHVTLCPEAELPPERDVAGQHTVIEVRDFCSDGPNDYGHDFVVKSANAKIWNYGAPFDSSPAKKLRLEDHLPLANLCIVNVRGERADGGGGAPYFADNGKVFAFHASSLLNYSYEGRVLVRLRSFTTKYPHLFGAHSVRSSLSCNAIE
eukprot:scaffold11564_cov180-Ochromonas_danica.AAC.4